MAVPSTMADLTTNEATNSPLDSETVTAATRPSDYIRAHAAIIKTHSDSTAEHGATGAVVGTTNTQTLTNKTLTAAILGGTTDVSGGQLKFPASQSASANANTLDDYEEGNFTPTIVGGTSAGTGTYTSQIGRYTKIGNRVMFSCYVEWTAHTGTGAMRVSALPFTATADISSAVSLVVDSITYSGTAVALVNSGTSYASINSNATGAASSAVSIDSAGICWVAGNYLV